ncbi:MAG: hypothetical protein NXI32_17640, partial [bacterium]|nr:hypothetical protein [bacterium]
IKASPSDMSLIEQLIEVIDQVESPIQVETRGQVKMIPVVTKGADEVLAIIKQLYGDRIQGASTGGGGGAPTGGRGGGGGGEDRAQEAAAFFQALRGGGGRGGRGGSGQTQLAEPKIAISAEPSTNMLIVIAQPQDIAEIEALVAEIDKYGAADPEEIAVTGLGGAISGQLFADSITRMLGPQAQTNVSSASDSSSGSSSNASSGGGGDGGDDRSEAQRQAARAAFFERMRQSGGFGGFGGRGGGPPTGGAPGGAIQGRPGGFGGFGGGGFGGRGGGRGGGD